MWTAETVADWFLVRHSSEMQIDEGVDEAITQMKLHKLMYYAQGVYLALFNQRLFDEDLLAWKHGPVVASTHARFKGRKELDDDLNERQMENFESINDSEDSRMVLEAVYSQFGGYTAGQLRNMTHKETPWIEAYGDGVNTTALDDSSITSYFRENIVETE